MEIMIKKAVLHIMDRNIGMPVYSQEELNVCDDVITQYISQQCKKIYNDDACKNGCFQNESRILESVRNIKRDINVFLQESMNMTGIFYHCLAKGEDIPAGDLLITALEMDETPYIAIVKLDYKEAFTHFIDYSEKGTENKIIVNRAVYPSGTQKNSEGAIINLNDSSARIMEGRYSINGEKSLYFSNLFLECDTEMSPRESIKVMKNVAKEITKKHFGDEFEKMAHLKMALYENVEEKGEVELTDVATASFYENPEIRQEYIETVKAAGVGSRIAINGGEPERKFSKQKIKTDRGIEITIPMSVYRNRDVIEFINNPDGTSSIILKNINQIINRD
jgi:hypothetical protein